MRVGDEQQRLPAYSRNFTVSKEPFLFLVCFFGDAETLCRVIVFLLANDKERDKCADCCAASFDSASDAYWLSYLSIKPSKPFDFSSLPTQLSAAVSAA